MNSELKNILMIIVSILTLCYFFYVSFYDIINITGYLSELVCLLDLLFLGLASFNTGYYLRKILYSERWND